MRNGFYKGHGLGNDYIVMDPKELDFRLTPRNIRLICDRNMGVGSDGILAVASSEEADFGLRIYNPDGERGGEIWKRPSHFCPLPARDPEDKAQGIFGRDQRGAGSGQVAPRPTRRGERRNSGNGQGDLQAEGPTLSGRSRGADRTSNNRQP